MNPKGILAVTLLTILGISVTQAEDVLEALRKDSGLSKFYELVNQDEVVRTFLQKRTATVLAPTNEAMERSKSKLRDQTRAASYHVLNLLAPKDTFPVSKSPVLAGAPPVYLTVKEPKTKWGEKEYFVNNAKIIRTQQFRASDDQIQILYVIDEVLTPYVANTNTPPPDALKFLDQPSTYGIQDSLALFSSRVRSERQESLFSRVGYHTFFVPVGGGLGEAKLNKIQDVDGWVIKGHVIPNKVLFTRTMGEETYKSEAFGSTVKVELSVMNTTDPEYGDSITCAKSNTLQSDLRHRKGVVLTKIVRPNIPVSNGVVHLIEDPLMIIDITIWDYLQKEATAYSDFYQLVSYAPEFRSSLENSQEKTLFVPTNEAIRKLSPEKFNQLKSNITAINNLLRLHLVMKSISSEDTFLGKTNEILSTDNQRSLYFKVVGDERHRVLTVEGGGVNATAIHADIGAIDGLVHVIDRLLGMPYQTVFEKLVTDSDLSISYNLGKTSGWTEQLTDITQRFTLFIPSNEAWKNLQLEMPSQYKQINMGLNGKNVKMILDRHLSVKHELSLQDLEKLDFIDMIGGTFKIVPGYNFGEMVVEWEGLRATIVRSDVQATNGVIHVIDKVLMKPRDMSATSSAAHSTSSLLALFLWTVVTIALVYPH